MEHPVFAELMLLLCLVVSTLECKHFPLGQVKDGYTCICTLCSLQILACSAGTGVLATWPAKLGQKSSSAEQENEGAWKVLQHGSGCPAVRHKFPVSL